MTVRAGIDLSMSSPVVCVHNDANPLKFDNCAVYSFGNFSRCKSLVGTYQNISILKQPPWVHDLERFQKIAQWVCALVKLKGVQKVCIEDYAYAAKGKVFEIAEMTGIVKYELFRRGVPVSPSSPGHVKKEFTGNGSAKKNLMWQKFCETEPHVDLVKRLQLSRFYSAEKLREPWELKPVDDIIDSWAVLKTHPDFKEINHDC